MKASYIIIHHSLTKDSKTVSWQAIRRYHLAQGWAGIGYHFGIELINNEYEILCGRMIDKVGAHTKGMNAVSIGICVVGNFDIEIPNQKIITKLTRLVDCLCAQLKIPRKNIKGHCDFAPKTCPGKNLYPILEKLRCQ